MKIIIIEDEALTAENLKDSLLEVEPDIQISAILDSVKNAVSWFKSNEHPDLIFSDIQLGDGLSFEIFNQVPITTPVVFCTAFDEYAIKAFKANGIDYILKPFDEQDIANSLKRFDDLKKKFTGNQTQLNNMFQLFRDKFSQQKKSVLVYFKDKIFPIKVSDIAIFYLENKITYLVTFDHLRYNINKSLEDLETLAGDDFYRANRQFLIQRSAIKEVVQYFARSLVVKLTIPFEKEIRINKVKVPDFLSWMSGK